MSWTDMIAGDRRDPSAVIDDIFGQDGLGRAQRWATATLGQQGVDPSTDPLDAMKVLRDAQPRLSLKATKFLTDSLTH
ncbi:MAG: hypothetical protein WBF79_05935 [Rhodococcus sp. (in: high G+C Gram-positive bacteria)]